MDTTGNAWIQWEGRWLHFSQPHEILATSEPCEIPMLLARLDAAHDEGFHIVGAIGYEASPGVDAALVTHEPGEQPVVWFGVYRDMEAVATLPFEPCGGFEREVWSSSLTRAEYESALRKIREYIAAGDTYQVNYTMRLRNMFSGQPECLFAQLCRAQRPRYAVYLDMGRFVLCSASPELFFAEKGHEIFSKPMKGTASRGLSYEDDIARKVVLAQSEKNQAENVMIVDMIRNDLGKIAEKGSVTVDPLFAVETYPTVHQMISCVKARHHASFGETISALFPCASITGAPKVRTMEIIRELEADPRGFYTGMAGAKLANGDSMFNVCIRTCVIDRKDGTVLYGTGGGIVWDSVNDAEYEECLLKAAVLKHDLPEMELLETLKYDCDSGYALLEAHIERASQSAAYFGFPFDGQSMRESLETAVRDATETLKVRWLMGPDGVMRTEVVALGDEPRDRPVGVLPSGCDSRERFLYHKTTCRDVYESALRRFNDVRDVILCNERDEVTESCFANIVVELDGRLVTPPVSCGLLNGTLRRTLVRSREVAEWVVSREDLWKAARCWLINSVRGWMPVSQLVKPD